MGLRPFSAHTVGPAFRTGDEDADLYELVRPLGLRDYKANIGDPNRAMPPLRIYSGCERGKTGPIKFV
jgi:hypothetical protein